MHNPLPQPTLPDIKLDDEDMDDGTSIRTRVPGANDYYYADYKNAYASDYPPPMPAYSQQYGNYPSSVHSNGDDPSLYYADHYDSQTNLTAAAAPMASNNQMTNPHSANYNGGFGYEAQNGGYNYAQDAHAGYGQDIAGAYAVGGDAHGYGQQGQGQQGQAYQNYGYGYEQDIGQTNGGYAYEPQNDHLATPTQLTSVPPRTASRAQNHQYDAPAYQQPHQGYNNGAGYDAYGRSGGGGAGYAS